MDISSGHILGHNMTHPPCPPLSCLIVHSQHIPHPSVSCCMPCPLCVVACLPLCCHTSLSIHSTHPTLLCVVTCLAPHASLHTLPLCCHPKSSIHSTHPTLLCIVACSVPRASLHALSLCCHTLSSIHAPPFCVLLHPSCVLALPLCCCASSLIHPVFFIAHATCPTLLCVVAWRCGNPHVLDSVAAGGLKNHMVVVVTWHCA